MNFLTLWWSFRQLFSPLITLWYSLASLLIWYLSKTYRIGYCATLIATASLPRRHSKLDLVTEQFSSASNVNEKLFAALFIFLRGSLFGIGIGFGFKPGSEKKELEILDRRIPGTEDEKIRSTGECSGRNVLRHSFRFGLTRAVTY